jgi:hypothetical protein
MTAKGFFIRLLFGITMLLLLSGCKTYEYFNISVLEPGTLFIPSRYQKLLVTHNITPNNREVMGSKLLVLDDDYAAIAQRDSLFAHIAVNVLTESLNEAGRFEAETVSLNDIILPKNSLDFTNAHILDLQALCQQKNADAIAILNSLRLVEYFEIFFNDFSIPFGYITSEITAQWLLIDPFSQKLIDTKTIRDTLYSRVSKPYDYLAGFDELTYIIPDDYAIETAMNYSMHLSPHFASTERMVFKSGGRTIRRGYKQVLAGDWKQAAAHWREDLTAEDNRARAKAAFNLALAAEMEGLPEVALIWAERSFNYFPDSTNSVYIRILEERIRNQQDIILQMEGR